MDIHNSIAHVYKDEKGHWHEHLLIDHLNAVAKLSKKFADTFGNGDWAALAGLWHDLGKYSVEFQNYIRNASGYNADAHIENSQNKVDHSAAGAQLAVEKFEAYGNILAYLIAGHHTGLPDYRKINAPGASLEERLQDKELLNKVIKLNPPQELIEQSKPTSYPTGNFPSLWIRMLFSCLVDADFLDTELFMDSGKSKLRLKYSTLEQLSILLNQHLQNFLNNPQKPIDHIRNNILQQCLNKSDDKPGIYSLTVPTGGGKTLSSMAFALNHAIKYQKQRIIYVIPYTSIIEQNAEIFRDIFGNNVIEHHSNLDLNKETTSSRLACENWDAPIIVTTNVQFFESLFASKTSKTRKLHNIVNSVVILDEAQLLPPEFLKPMLLSMQELVDAYTVTFLICTATQPAFQERKSLGWHFEGLKNITEIIEDKEKLNNDLKRVDIQLPHDFKQQQSWQEISEQLQQYQTVLCIVNRRDDCRKLCQLMPSETVHLSALMCGEHRSQIIKKINNQLESGKPIRVISTQLVEAGVDLDFPIVFRAMAGLDSIAQAAGRCNREGKLKRGKVIIFNPSSQPPPGLLRKAEQVARTMLMTNIDDPISPIHFQHFFEELYWKIIDLDKYNILKDLHPENQLQMQFRTAANNFQIINNDLLATIIVIYGESQQLINEFTTKKYNRELSRKLQRYTISINKWHIDNLLKSYDIEEIDRGLYVQINPKIYDEKYGFTVTDNALIKPEDFVC